MPDDPTIESANVVRRVAVVSAGSFPTKARPVHGVFVKERLRYVAQAGIEVKVVSPVPYFPAFLKPFKRWSTWTQFPRHEIVDGLPVERPRYLLLPKIGGYFHAKLIYPVAKAALDRMQRQFDFDLIDSHFAYPNGVAAVRLGQHFDKPVVITGRGEDIAKFPDLPIIGKQIRWALQNATRLIAVSGEIADRMESLGADPNKITVIENGVDVDKFSPVPQDEARRKLNLPEHGAVILAVGYRLELKGFHILVDALPEIRKKIPNARVVIVGGQAGWAADYLPEIQQRIEANGVEDHVILAGNRPQDELRYWYSAADVLSILSSREGSPNVLMEALACGLPAVATEVGAIPQVMSTDPRLGKLLPARTAEAAATGIAQILANPTDRKVIRSIAQGWGWENTAQRVIEVFNQAIDEYSPKQQKG